MNFRKTMQGLVVLAGVAVMTMGCQRVIKPTDSEVVTNPNQGTIVEENTAALEVVPNYECGYSMIPLVEDGSVIGYAEVAHSETEVVVNTSLEENWYVKTVRLHSAATTADAPYVDGDLDTSAFNTKVNAPALTQELLLTETLPGSESIIVYLHIELVWDDGATTRDWSNWVGEEDVFYALYGEKLTNMTICAEPTVIPESEVPEEESVEEIPVSSSEAQSSSAETTDPETDPEVPVEETPEEPFVLTDICGMTADGRTIGFWKNNITKAIAGKTKGTQVSPEDLNSWLSKINAEFPKYANLTLEGAVVLLSNTSREPNDLLEKQLIGSLFNYARGALIENVDTKAFMEGGIEALESTELSDEEKEAWKNAFDDYNNSHGGTISGETCK